MSDIQCPYCGSDQEIIHDDGQGYEEDVRHEQECSECEETFEFTTSITYLYTPYCKDGDHKIVPMGDRWPGMYECENCEYFYGDRDVLRRERQRGGGQ